MKSALRFPSVAIAAILFLSNNISAQINPSLGRGNFAIGSGIGYNNTVTNVQINNDGDVTQGGNTALNLHITPSIGYFLARNFVVGLGMDYLATSSRNTNPEISTAAERTSDTKLLFGPYGRIYFPFAGDQAFFLGAVYGYGRSETQITSGGQTQVVNTTLTTLGAGPGYAIFSNRRVSLEAQAKYNYGASRNVFNLDGGSQSTRTLTTAWDFVLGMHFYFNRQRGTGE